MAENTRLGDLTRMLLSSAAFSSFLADLSGTSLANAIPEPPQSQSQLQNSPSRSQTAAPRKDVNPNQTAPCQLPSQGQNNNNIGLTMIPEESSFEYSATESANTGYTDNMDFGLYDAQVYAVTAVPQGPAVDTMLFANLHGKSSNFVGPYSPIDDAKNEPLPFEVMPMNVGVYDISKPIETSFEDLDIVTSDPAFALFVDEPTSTSQTPQRAIQPEVQIFGEIELEKAFRRVELAIDDDPNDNQGISSATREKFERLCLRLDAVSARIGAIVPHL